MKLTPVWVDHESWWSQTHSLAKMSATEYVLHPDTELISVSVKVGSEPTEVVFGETEIRKLMQSVNWKQSMHISHNVSFDACITAWRLGINPAMWGCTLAMARPTYAKTCGVSLAALVRELGLGVKDSTALLNTKGKHLKDFTAEELEAMRVYNAEDTELCRKLFYRLIKDFPRKELHHIDMTTRMLVEPKFELDTRLLTATLTQEKTNKSEALFELDDMLETAAERAERRLSGGDSVEEHVRKILASAAKFSEILTSRGVAVPMKPSPTNPTKQVPALAKTDEAFIALQEHEDEVVATAARCRLAIKSTLLETRIEAFLKAGGLCGGLLPVPLRYCGADTTGRLSGEQYNPQNLPRINPKAPKLSDALRMSLRAPKGYKVVVSDLSGIELRVNHFLWQVQSTMELYAGDPEADLYRAAGAVTYGVEPEHVTKEQRQIEKIKALGLGFGAGGPTFKRVAKTLGGLIITDEVAAEWVVQWRDRYSDIVAGWKKCGQALKHVAAGQECAVDPWGLVHTSKRGLHLPSGRIIHYPALHEEELFGEFWPDGRPKTSWFYGQGARNRARITGPKTDENIVQALARDVISDNAYDVFQATGYRPVLVVHDELVYIVPEDDAESHLATVNSFMRKPPTWWPELITWSEGGYGDCYGEVK